ncbi:MAG: SAM-dependent methyltransferase, partial [Pseudomonadota bacterium]
VVAYPETGRGSFAARIAEAHIGGATQFGFSVPMTGDGAAEAVYDEAAKTIAKHLDNGRSVALLCEGDPMLYGSAASVMERLAGHHEAEIIPGVTAAAACAAAAGVSLVRGEEPLTILPATADPSVLKRALRTGQALVLYKVGRHFDRIAAMIRAAGRSGTLVSHGTLPDETVASLAHAPAGPKPYFSTVVLPTAAPRPSTAGASIAIIALTATALPTAQKAKAALIARGRDALIHGLVDRVDADVAFGDVLHHIAGLFEAGTPIVGLCAAGILIRAAGPLLTEKTAEPPVVALSEDGATVVPLLGTHHGGSAIAGILGEAFTVRPAFTTRSEATMGAALDDPPEGWVVADFAPFKALAAKLPALGKGQADDALSFLPKREGWPTDIRATIGAPDPAVPTYIARRVALGMR